MQVNTKQFTDDGFLILRGIIQPPQLNQLRASMEVLLDRKKALTEHEGQPWHKSAQIGVLLHEHLDEATANTVEFSAQDETLGVSRQLMRAPHAAVNQTSCQCSGDVDYGPARWHRDISPGHPAPLRGLQANARDHGPGCVQWNIALYDDSIFWVVPGSHFRVDIDVEHQQMLEDPRVPLPASVPVVLGAGDAIVYSHFILHWASNYSRILRRTLMFTYRSLNAGAFSPASARGWNTGFIRYLTASSRRAFESFDRLFRLEVEDLDRLFRAILVKDVEVFHDALAHLHAGQTGRMVSIVILSKFAKLIQQHHQLDLSGLSAADRAVKLKRHWGCGPDWLNLACRYSPVETETLWRRFAVLDEKLKLKKAVPMPTSQGTQDHQYRANDMPEDFQVDDFIASWGN